MKRYRLICVADLPDRGSYDDLDEAIVNSDQHYEVYDTQAGPDASVEERWPGAYCKEDYDAAVERWQAKLDGEDELARVQALPEGLTPH